MAIKIIDEPDISLTRAEFDSLRAQYNKAFRYFAGHPPSFETWVRDKLNQRFIDGML
jgi:hypothetical protein